MVVQLFICDYLLILEVQNTDIFIQGFCVCVLYIVSVHIYVCKDAVFIKTFKGCSSVTFLCFKYLYKYMIVYVCICLYVAHIYMHLWKHTEIIKNCMAMHHVPLDSDYSEVSFLCDKEPTLQCLFSLGCYYRNASYCFCRWLFCDWLT